MGGDPEVFRAGLDAFRALASTGPAGRAGVHHPVEVHHRRHGAAVLLDWLAAARRRRRRPPRVT